MHESHRLNLLRRAIEDYDLLDRYMSLWRDAHDTKPWTLPNRGQSAKYKAWKQADDLRPYHFEEDLVWAWPGGDIRGHDHPYVRNATKFEELRKKIADALEALEVAFGPP